MIIDKLIEENKVKVSYKVIDLSMIVIDDIMIYHPVESDILCSEDYSNQITLNHIEENLDDFLIYKITLYNPEDFCKFTNPPAKLIHKKELVTIDELRTEMINNG